MDFGVYHALALRHLGEAYVLAGRPLQARLTAARALHLSRERRQRGYEAYALRLCAEVAVRVDPPEVAEAEARYGGALALAEESGMRPLAARCHLGLGALHRRTGARQQAGEELQVAATMCREMDMPLWRDLVEAELAALA